MVFVKLIAYTKLTDDAKDIREKRRYLEFIQEDKLSDPELVCAVAARLSITNTPPLELLQEDKEKLGKSLNAVLSQRHFSVIEHANFTFLIWGLSRIISQQLTRHRIASFTQRGQRYVTAKNAGFIIPKSIMDSQKTFLVYSEAIQNGLDAYKKLLEYGVPKEDARFVLMNAIETSLVVTMNARELLHFFELRLCEKAQWEIREVAIQMLTEVLKVAPRLFKNAGPPCISQGRCYEKKKNVQKCREIVATIKSLKEKYIQ